MGVEIERKYLLQGDGWRTLAEPVLLRQGYLSSQRERVVRVRIEGQHAMLTIKGANVGTRRGEWEYPIPLVDANELLDGLCEQPLIEKYRRRIMYAGMVWEVDEFLGANFGLVVAEIELHSVDQPFEKPDWIGAEVSDDTRYYNANLIRHPYSQW
ncbi:MULTISPECIES: CYTH domain-containing protein [unclassified Janthinobacterium]|uniref:CYTH domain-containing protein n=1 Tax=unclassified Janthinobacterium TaxID=2610881 RepID=UPI001622CB33|nr:MULTISPECIES: CYTH domain-containing protein [unclassified Janthinobacterium]MBB5607702.1 CYTH domain-containing protein [Janthinobacterium sp. S3T4]MBB5613150.1 CYTH domain-containing protein [Janthinobacterium sp. S3M3]